MPLGPQLASLEHAPHVVVGTPGRIQELLRKQRAEPVGAAHAGARRSRPHARHGLRGTDPRDRRQDAEDAPEPAVLGDLPRGRSARSAAALLREPMEVTVEGGEQHAAIDQRFYEVEPTQEDAAAGGAAAAVQARIVRGVLQHAPRCRRGRRLAGALRLHRAGAARRHGAARPRRSAGALRQPQLHACWSPATSPRAGSTSRNWRWWSTTTCRTDPDIYVHRIGRTGRAGSDGAGAEPVRAARAGACERASRNARGCR